MKKRFTEQKGFATSDALVAILIITLFASLIASISYNIYLTNSSVKRMSKATNYIVDMFEYIDKIYYDDVTIENLTSYFNNKYYYEADMITIKQDAEVKVITSQGEETGTPFKAELILVNYNETEGNEDKFDLVKEITMKVTYKLGNKDQTVEMKRIKQRENLEIPNKPDLNVIEVGEGEKVYPIKKVNEEWVVCDYRDNNWYNYEKGNLATILKTDKDLNIGEKIDLNNLSENEIKYEWIPRYAYNGTDLLFLFSNSNKYIDNEEGYNTLKPINEDSDENLYEIPKDFVTDEKPLEGIWVVNAETDAYKILYNVYELQK